MVKPAKYLRKQATKAESAADRIHDPEISVEMRALANAYRKQADALKKDKKLGKSRRAKRRAPAI